MILEEETFEKFGYYSTDLKLQSNKKIVAVCDDCGQVRVRSKQGYRALCSSCAVKGERNPNYGKHHSEGTRKKMSIARKHQHFPLHHTKPERIFEEICKGHNLPFKYTGDGSFWIGKSPSVNPDFVECNGKKLAVEIFGDYWHSPLLKNNLKYSQTFKGRKEVLKKFGWKLIVLWEGDLKRKDAEQFVLSTLKKEGVQ